jgi:hypothetical protein
MAFETIIASVLLPAAVDLVKNIGGAVSRKFVGLSVDEQIKLNQSELNKLEVISKLDNPYGTPSQWVVDVRAIYRYAAATLVIIVGLIVVGYGFNGKIDSLTAAGLDLIGMPFGFIFGERMYLGFKGAMTK